MNDENYQLALNRIGCRYDLALMIAQRIREIKQAARRREAPATRVAMTAALKEIATGQYTKDDYIHNMREYDAMLAELYARQRERYSGKKKIVK